MVLGQGHPKRERKKQPHRQTQMCTAKSTEMLTEVERHRWHCNTVTKRNTWSGTHTHTHKCPTQGHSDRQTQAHQHSHTRAHICKLTQVSVDTDTHSLKHMHKKPHLQAWAPLWLKQDSQPPGLSLLLSPWMVGLIMGQYQQESVTWRLHWALLPADPLPAALPLPAQLPRTHRRLPMIRTMTQPLFGDQSSLLSKEAAPPPFPPGMRYTPCSSPNKIALSLHWGLVILRHHLRTRRLERALAWVVGAIEQNLDLT